MKLRKDLSGKTFGEWEVLSYSRGNGAKIYYKCRCSCGLIKDIKAGNLRTGQSTRCKACSSKKQQKDKGDLVPRRYWNTLKKNAEWRNIDVLITKKQSEELMVKQNWKCALTDLPIDFGIAKNFKSKTASLDRIDSTKPYTIDNVWWVSKEVNMMKQSMSVDRLFELCELIVKKGKPDANTGLTS